MKKYKLTSVESFITKHASIIEHFAIFFSFLNQIKQFLSLDVQTEGLQMTQKWMLLLFSSSPIFSSFWVLFWVI